MGEDFKKKKEIVVWGKLLIQHLVPRVVLQLCDTHSGAAVHSPEDRHSLVRQADVSNLAAKKSGS